MIANLLAEQIVYESIDLGSGLHQKQRKTRFYEELQLECK